jgi:hypothetical protein
MFSNVPPAPSPRNGPAGNARPLRARDWLVVAALVVLCAIPYLRSYQHRNDPLGEDEIYWIGQTYYFHLAFEKLDWSNPDWHLLPARENPALGKFLLGSGLRLNGLSVTNPDWLGVFYLIAKDRPNAWGAGRDFQDRVAVVQRMTPAVRDLALRQGQFDCPIQFATTARAIMVLFGMVSVLAVYYLASLYAGRGMALVAALLFVLHPAVTEAYTEVSMDILAVAFSLLAVIHFVLIERRVWHGCRRPGLGRALVCAGGGLCLALAVGSKMNAVVAGLLGAVLGGIWLVEFLRTKAAGAGESFKAMLAVLVVALLLFAGLNPVDYPNPLAGVWHTYADQQRSLDVQKTIPAVRKPLEGAAEHVRALAAMTAMYPALFALLAAAFFWELVKSPSRGGLPVIGLWWVIAVLAVGLWLPFARPRYALPVIAPSVVLICTAWGCSRQKSKLKTG